MVSLPHLSHIILPSGLISSISKTHGEELLWLLKFFFYYYCYDILISFEKFRMLTKLSYVSLRAWESLQAFSVTQEKLTFLNITEDEQSLLATVLTRKSTCLGKLCLLWWYVTYMTIDPGTLSNNDYKKFYKHQFVNSHGMVHLLRITKTPC